MRKKLHNEKGTSQSTDRVTDELNIYILNITFQMFSVLEDVSQNLGIARCLKLFISLLTRKNVNFIV